MNYFSELRRFLYREWIPVTKGTIVISGIVLIISFLLKVIGMDLNELLVLNPLTVLAMPWTIITYPLVNDIISWLFGALWLWFVGGSLERSWGGRRLGLFMVLAVVLTGIVMALVGQVLKIAIPIYGFWLPLVGLTWAWGELFPDQELLFWGLFPIKGRWLAWIHALIIFSTYASNHLVLGLAAVSSILLAYLFQSKGPWGKRRITKSQKDNRHNQSRRSRLRVIK